MFSAFVGGRNVIWLQKYCTNYLFVELHTFSPLFFLYHHSFSSLRRTWWDGIKEHVNFLVSAAERMYRNAKVCNKLKWRFSRGPANPGSPG